MPSDPRSEFARLLRAVIEEGGFTQAQVAEAVGVTQPTVSAWMMGKVIPELPTVRKLANFLSADPAHWEQLKLESMASRARRGPKKKSSLPRDAAAATLETIDVSGLPAEDVEMIEQQVRRLKRLHGLEEE